MPVEHNPDGDQDAAVISHAMALLGRRGGRVRGGRKAEAVRANGRKGGRPKKNDRSPRALS